MPLVHCFSPAIQQLYGFEVMPSGVLVIRTPIVSFSSFIIRSAWNMQGSAATPTDGLAAMKMQQR